MFVIDIGVNNGILIILYSIVVLFSSVIVCDFLDLHDCFGGTTEYLNCYVMPCR